MIHKIIGGKGKQRNIRSSINYLLRKNKPEEQQYIKVLTAINEDDLLLFNKTVLTNKKHPYVCGCLSFEEKNIEESIKYELIEDLESALFAGISKENRPPILWVQHTDKGRLELNYLTFNQLQDGRSYTTYLHKNDKKLIESLKDFYNLKYQFSNPKDPNKKNIVSSRATNDSDEKATTQARINNMLLTQIALNNINNRDELIKYVENELKLEVTRDGKDYITIKINDKKIRFKGEIYEAERDYRAYATSTNNTIATDAADNERLATKSRKDFDRLYRAKYKRNEDRFTKTPTENNANTDRAIIQKNELSDLNKDPVDFNDLQFNLNNDESLLNDQEIVQGQQQEKEINDEYDINRKANFRATKENRKMAEFRARINAIRAEQQYIDRQLNTINTAAARNTQQFNRFKQLYNKFTNTIKAILRYRQNRNKQQQQFRKRRHGI